MQYVHVNLRCLVYFLSEYTQKPMYVPHNRLFIRSAKVSTAVLTLALLINRAIFYIFIHNIFSYYMYNVVAGTIANRIPIVSKVVCDN